MCYECPTSYSSGPSYSTNYSAGTLDALVGGSHQAPSHIEYLISAPEPTKNTIEQSVSELPQKEYSQKSDDSDYKLNSTPYFTPAAFLEPTRPLTQFIQNAGQIKDYIMEAFLKTTGEELPNNIIITICPESDMAKVMEYEGGKWNPQIQGFALNQKTPKIFIKQGQLDQIMVTVGHELGHVLSDRLPNSKDEEAKAFAFSLAWIKTIKEHNIANLADCIRVAPPAQNGIHDTALSFAQKLIETGKNALDVFHDLKFGIVSVNQ